MSSLALGTATREDIDRAGPVAFMDSLTSLNDAQVGALFDGPNRATLLDAMFETMPSLFRPERAGSTDATVRWNITGGPAGGDIYSMRVVDGTCTVLKGAEGEPSVTLSMSAPDFVKVASKAGNPMMMFMTGKIKAAGDIALAANVGGFFSTPGA